MYLLKDRKNVSHVIRTFFNEIQNQFAVTPKIFRTDNALEFLQNDVQSFCTDCEILY